MVRQLQPYELTEHYHRARHNRFDSCLFSGLSLSAALAGLGLFLGMPHGMIRNYAAGSCWLGSLVLASRASNSSRESSKYSNRIKALNQFSEESIIFDLAKGLQITQPGTTMATETPTFQPNFYNWNDAIHEGVGFIIAGNSGAGKSSVATWLAGLLTQETPAQCLVLDPHWNDIWQQQGLTAIGKIEEIEATMKALLKELDQRCDRKGKKQPIGDPLLIIADEIGSCLDRFSDPKWVISTLKRLGSEGRKFGMTLIAINQSQNVDDIGISGPLRSNYVLILIGASARAQAKQMGKEYQALVKGLAYPCVISGSVEDALAVHPTHAPYAVFKKSGNPPQNLIPIRQLPLSFVVEGVPALAVQEQSGGTAIADQENVDVQYLQRCLDLPVTDLPKELKFDIDELLPELQPIARFSFKHGWVKAADCQRNIRALKGISTEQIREYFQILVAQGYGACRGEIDNLEYSVFGT